MDRVSVGVIGVGPMGARPVRKRSPRPGAQGRALMDADEERLAHAFRSVRNGRGVPGYARPDPPFPA